MLADIFVTFAESSQIRPIFINWFPFKKISVYDEVALIVSKSGGGAAAPPVPVSI